MQSGGIQSRSLSRKHVPLARRLSSSSRLITHQGSGLTRQRAQPPIKGACTYSREKTRSGNSARGKGELHAIGSEAGVVVVS